MAQTLEALHHRINVVTELESVVSTMKALSAATIRQYENAVTALSDYYRTVELGLHAVLRDHQVPPPRQIQASNAAVGVIIIGSDQGLCGRFNELVLEHALLELADFPDRQRSILCVGSRVAANLQEKNQIVEECLVVPGSVHVITHTVEKILLHIDVWQTHHHVNDVLLFHNRPAAHPLYHPSRINLLPVDLHRFRQLHTQDKSWPSRALPTFTMPRKQLLTALLRQYFFVTLFRACAESLACEHAARLASMQRASKNIEEHLQVLNDQYRQQRQTSITEELLDIVAGYGALAEHD